MPLFYSISAPTCPNLYSRAVSLLREEACLAPRQGDATEPPPRGQAGLQPEKEALQLLSTSGCYSSPGIPSAKTAAFWMPFRAAGGRETEELCLPLCFLGKSGRSSGQAPGSPAGKCYGGIPGGSATLGTYGGGMLQRAGDPRSHLSPLSKQNAA